MDFSFSPLRWKSQNALAARLSGPSRASRLHLHERHAIKDNEKVVVQGGGGAGLLWCGIGWLGGDGGVLEVGVRLRVGGGSHGRHLRRK